MLEDAAVQGIENPCLFTTLPGILTELRHDYESDGIPNTNGEQRGEESLMKPEHRAALDLFYSYAHTDEELRNELEKHLSLLKRQGLIRDWHDRKISAGQDLDCEIDSHIETADIILMLISSDFQASDYCYAKEMTRALERHMAGLARVIPVILRPVDWHPSPFGKLLGLPTDGKAVTSWLNRDEAFVDVARGIRRAVEELIEQRDQEVIRLEQTVANPKYGNDMRALDGRYDLTAIANRETVAIITGNTVVAELLDRPAAERLRDEIDRRGKPYPYRRAIVMTFETWQRDTYVHSIPVISIGGPPANDLTKELNVPPASYVVAPGVYGSYRKQNGVLQVALWGDNATQTRASVENYINRKDGLESFLASCWQPPAR
jgi:hypothetical protein